MAVRSREEAIALRNDVLERWAAGQMAGEIAQADGITRGYADVIFCNARAAGDPRAAWRPSSNGGAFIVPLAREAAVAPSVAQPALSPFRRARRGRPRAGNLDASTRREFILDAWSAGQDAPQIATALGMRWKSVTMVVLRARDRGDPRAVRRQADPANGLRPSLRAALERAARRHGVTVTTPEDCP